MAWPLLSKGSDDAAEIPLPKTPVALKGHLVGSEATARVAVIEFSDFHCPFCREFSKSVKPKLMEKYVDTGKVVWSFRELPLTGVHPEAAQAAIVAECAAGQGRFWQAHDFLFSNAIDAHRDLAAVSKQLVLDRRVLEACVRNSPNETLIADREEATRLSVSGTPTFFLGLIDGDHVFVRERVSGLASTERFGALLDKILRNTSR